MAAWEAATKVEREACDKRIEELSARFTQLESDAFRMAAGQCPVNGMLVGDEGGNQSCRLSQALEAMDDKLKALASHGTCGCSYDRPGDICDHHSPHLTKANARIAELESKNYQLIEVNKRALTLIRENHDLLERVKKLERVIDILAKPEE